MRQALAAAFCLALCACSTTLDVDRARRWLEAPGEPELPQFSETRTADLAAPEGVRTTSGELRQIPLRWDPVLTGDVGGYALERATRREGPFEMVGSVAGRVQTVWVDTGPSRWPGTIRDRAREIGDGETLFYRVRAFDPTGELAETASEVVAGTTAPPPEAPEGLRAYSQQPREVPLSWEASPDPQVGGYVIERSPTSRGPFERLARVEGRHATTWVDRGLGDLRVFHYRVSAVNSAGGEGPPSQPVRAVTKPEPLPPLGLAVVAQRLGENELTWEPNVEPDLFGYRLLRIREAGEGSELVASLPADRTRAIDRDVGAGERVSYTIVAIDDDGLESAAAQAIAAESIGYELSARARPDGVHLEWNPRREQGFQGGRVFLDATWRQKELGFVDGGRFVHSEVEPGRSYRYFVVLERADGTAAPPSSLVEVSVP